MAQFYIKTNTVGAEVDAENTILAKLSEAESDIRTVSNSLAFQVAAKANIRNRLSNAANRVSAHRAGMSSMSSALQDVISTYERTENAIKNNTHVQDADIQDVKTSGYGSINDIAADFINSLLEAIDGGEYRDYILGRIDSIKEFIENAGKGGIDLSSIPLIFGLPDMIKGDINEFNSFIDGIKQKIIDKTGFKGEIGTSGSLYQSGVSCANGSLGLTLGAYEAYASAQGGLFTKDKDGNIVFNPNIDAKMGASFTAMEAAGAYAVGDDWFGAGVSGNVTMGKVSGEASMSASFRDADGSINPHVKMDASAEAILIDAKAQAGATVLGTKAEVEASVNVGVGAHANVEAGDGVISCDIGASFGFGASISFTIDYGGTVDAIKETAKGMAESVKNMLKWW